MKKRRKMLLKYDRKIKSSLILTNLTKNTDLLKYDKICIYLSAFNEPDTFELLKLLFKKGKTVFVPVTDTKTETVHIYKINNLELKKGAYNISEPKYGVLSNYNEPDFIVIPGLAFDLQGNRIGFGKGYYDKFLSASNAVKAALCYDFQICDNIPSQNHDIKMDYLVTEKRIVITDKDLIK